MFNLTTGLLVYLCENLRITAKIGGRNGYLKLCCYTTNDLSQCFHSSNIAQLQMEKTSNQTICQRRQSSAGKGSLFCCTLKFSCFKLDELWGNRKHSALRCSHQCTEIVMGPRAGCMSVQSKFGIQSFHSRGSLYTSS